MSVKVVFHEEFYQVYSSDPASAAGRMESIIEVIKSQAEFVEPGPASVEDIALVHSEPHIHRIEQAGLYDIAALAAGGAIRAATIGLSEPCFGVIRPPGHHASAGSSWGFCYFNNMAIALENLKRKGLITSAYVLDIDLHFGDGTVNILKGSDYARVHNVAAGHRKAYLDEVQEEMEDCKADIIGISAGFDNHEQDWGGTLTTEDYRVIGRMVRDSAASQGSGAFAILEGGYNHAVLGRNVSALMKGLAGEGR